MTPNSTFERALGRSLAMAEPPKADRRIRRLALASLMGVAVLSTGVLVFLNASLRQRQTHMDLQAMFPQLLPRAIAWAQDVAADAAARGTSLTASSLADAATVGVQRPESIRVLMIDRLPIPSDPDLQRAALQTGLLGPHATGLTLGYSILICHGHFGRRLLSHECRHVAQYEQAGSIESFLPIYLRSIMQFGYWDCPFEREARAHELPDA